MLLFPLRLMKPFNTISTRVRILFSPNLFNSINFGSLVLAFTIALIILQFITYEFSFEKSNPNSRNVFRVNLYNTENGAFKNWSSQTVSGLAYEMSETMPGIESVGRLSSEVTGGIVANKSGTVKSIETSMVTADPEIITLLDVRLKYHSGDTLSIGIKSVLISEATSLKYFGTLQSAGDILNFGFNNNSIEMTSFVVAGVFEDVPQNAIHRFDFIFPVGNQAQWDQNWDWSNAYTFVKFHNRTRSEGIDKAFADIVKKHHRDDTGDRYQLEALSDIRLRALDGSGSMSRVKTFAIISIAILILAWLNYINIATAQFLTRIKEVGIRKLMGASRYRLLLHFMKDAFIINLISFAAALIVLTLSWGFISKQLQLPAKISILTDWTQPLILFLLLSVSSILSGFYPAIFLSSFSPLRAIKGYVANGYSRGNIRKALVSIQLTISIILVVAVFAVNKQLQFMRHADLGLTLDHTLLINGPVMSDNTYIEKFEPFKSELLALPGIKAVTYASSFPGKEIDWHRSDITITTRKDFVFDSRVVAIGTEFLDFFSIPVLAGRNFREGLNVDQKAMLLNEEAIKMFGFETTEQALGEVISMGPRNFEIIGVIKNYHFRSVKHSLQPMLFLKGYPRAPTYAVKFKQDEITQLIPQIEKIWKSVYGDNVFFYEFLDKNFEREYAAEILLQKISRVLTSFALLIAFAGICGLSVYSVNQRIKEIGIRKVFGASTGRILVHLAKDYFISVTVGILAGLVISNFLLDRWLEYYVYKMEITWMLYTYPGFIVLLLIAVAVAIQYIVSSSRNVIDTLRHD